MVESVDPFINTSSGLVPVLRSHIFTMVAAFAGVLLGIAGSAGFVGSYLQSQFDAQTNALQQRLVSLTPTADETSAGACYSPNTGGSGGDSAAAPAVTAAATTPATLPEGGRGGDEGGGGTTGSNTFVQQLITGTISNTGAGSYNNVTASNSYRSTTVNNNDVSVDNDNDQHADSGNASAVGNGSAGSTQSGDAQNTNTTTTNVTIEN